MEICCTLLIGQSAFQTPSHHTQITLSYRAGVNRGLFFFNCPFRLPLTHLLRSRHLKYRPVVAPYNFFMSDNNTANLLIPTVVSLFSQKTKTQIWMSKRIRLKSRMSIVSFSLKYKHFCSSQKENLRLRPAAHRVQQSSLGVRLQCTCRRKYLFRSLVHHSDNKWTERHAE